MNKIITGSVTAMLVAGLVSYAGAEGYSGAKSEKGMSERSQASESMAKGTFQERISGKVTEIDQSKGQLSMSSDKGRLRLQFPPNSLSNVKEGEQVTARLALHKGTTTSQAFDAPVQNALGHNSMTGTIRDIDHNKGRVTIESAQNENQNMELYFPSADLKSLSKGEQVTVNVALFKQGQAGSEHRMPQTQEQR